ncbi:MAG: response regulator [Candidatus Edwardsbacteria bacterium]|nr:response regulator [Candidatus Edwardsbacteria bacterium]
MKDKPSILVVDDQPLNIELLEAYLIPHGYEIVKAASGQEALEIISNNQIDLILLDVMMPSMNGFEVCRILKKRAEYLPVIMITALGSRDSRLKGIESGADDFLSKPFDSTELKLKVSNLIKIKTLYDKVENNYREIKVLDEMKDSLTSFIVHDLRSPLAGIMGYLGLLAMSNKLEKQDSEYVEKATQSVTMLTGMIANLLDMAKMENNEMVINAEDHEINEVLSWAIKVMTPMLNGKDIQLFHENPKKRIMVKIQKDLVERIVQNLLSNAIRYTPKLGIIMVESRRDEKSPYAMVSVSDSGSGIPDEHKQKVFDKFATVETKEKRIRGSTGLGLTFCKLAVELHGGKIWVEDRNGGGSVFRFTLPLAGVEK